MRQYGDKLPGSLLTDAEWRYLRDMMETEKEAMRQRGDKRLSKEFREKMIEELEAIAKERCVGDSSERCVLCGDDSKPLHQYRLGLCLKCWRGIWERDVLRQAGNTHKMAHKDTVCAACMSNPARSMGLCVSCLHFKKIFGLKARDVPKYYAMLEDRKYPSPDTTAYLTKVR